MTEQQPKMGENMSALQQQYNSADAKETITASVTAQKDKKGTEDAVRWKEGDPEMADPEDPRPEYGHLKTGEMAPADLIGFVKLREFEKFYSYSGDKQAEVKKCFFDGGRFWERRWDFFYIYPPPDIQTSAILLLPLDQAKHFLQAINRHLNTSIALPEQKEAPGLIMSSPNNGVPRPRYIASAADPPTASSLKNAIPGRSYLPEGERHNYVGYHNPTEEEFMEFRSQMEALTQTDLQRKDRERLKKEKATHVLRQAKGRELMRAQRYLGLRKRNARDAQGGHGLSSSTEMADLVLDVEKPTPFPQEASVIFICIDIEAYEFPPNPITEIGIATLDTADIVGIAPGENGRNWFKKIRARHFLIKEFRHLQNTQYVQGNRDGFVFGASEIIDFADVKRKVLECFQSPFSRSFGKPDEDEDTLSDLDDDLRAERNIVFVGHDVKQDIDYLRRLKVDLSEIPQIKDIVDSASVYQALRHNHDKLGLGKMLLDLGLVGRNLHNGGNDAVYTIQAMIATAMKSEVEKDELEEQHAEELEKRIEAVKDQQTQLLRKQKEGWELDEDSDGGDFPDDAFEQFQPKAPSQNPPKPKVTDPVKGPWAGDLAKNVAKPGPAIAYRAAQQQRGNPSSYNTWRPGIQAMRDEDIEPDS